MKIFVRRPAERIGSGPGRYIVPAWSSDGKWIYFASYDGTGLHRRLPVAGAEEELLLPRGREDKVISTDTRDGTLAFGVAIDPSNNRGFDIFRFDLHNRARRDWSATQYSESQPSLSPDDRWIAWMCGRSRSGSLCLSPREAVGKCIGDTQLNSTCNRATLNDTHKMRHHLVLCGHWGVCNGRLTPTASGESRSATSSPASNWRSTPKPSPFARNSKTRPRSWTN